MEKLIMSGQEREQAHAFRMVKSGEMSKTEAALYLRVSRRWVIKKYKRFAEMGDIGIPHQNRGKESPRRWNREQEAFAIDLLKSEWKGFGPTFASQKLESFYGIKISAETLRQAMIRGGIWDAGTRKIRHRSRRMRRACLGMMIQLDGSRHDWFEGRAPWCTLLVFIDDATSQVLWLEFAESESLKGVMQATQNYIKKYGRPVSFYTDYGSVFSVNTNNPDRAKITQFERALKELGIEIIHARSPQAKGRVERANKTLQDRLIKEMRLAGISSIEAANRFVQEVYLPDHNQRFAVEARQPLDLHKPLMDYDLSKILCIKDERKVMNDFILSYKNKLIQLSKEQKAVVRPKEHIVVHEDFNGAIRLFLRKIELDFTFITQRPAKQEEVKQVRNYCNKPAPNHPWRGIFRKEPVAQAKGEMSCTTN